jgi:hypothetical protein
MRLLIRLDSKLIRFLAKGNDSREKGANTDGKEAVVPG